MSNQVRAAVLLREAANLLNSNTSSSGNPAESSSLQSTQSNLQCNRNSAESSSTLSTFRPSQLRMASTALFAPYSCRSSGNRRRAAPASLSYWSHRFCVLARSNQDVVPNREEKSRLFSAGLGEKKISFIKSADTDLFKEKLFSVFPKLENCGGFELLRTTYNSKYDLQAIQTPQNGYSSQYLADESMLGQALCYVRPIQTDLDMDEVLVSDSDGVEENCLKCGLLVPLRCLRDHISNCGQKEDVVSSNNEDPPRKRSNRVVQQLPVCQFACANEKTTTDEHSDAVEMPCPLCGLKFSRDQLQIHASTCGEALMDVKDSKIMSLDEEMEKTAATLEKKKDIWMINVVRRNFLTTAMDELEGSIDSDWEKKIQINFIGEEGIDVGGLTREFYSLLFTKNDVFQNGTFRVDAALLEKKLYVILGKATARAIIAGHPGPRCFNPVVAKFICCGEEPDLTDIPDDYIGRADVIAAIQEILSDSADYEAIMNIHGDLLEQAGFRKALSSSTASQAEHALKRHFTFYHVIGPLLQFREGLKLLNVQVALQRHAESWKLFTACTVTALDIQNFFRADFSSQNDQLKQREEMIVYNFGKFLKKAERGTLLTPWVDIYDGAEKQVVINTGHVMQALVGCENLPRNLNNGIIEFNHTSNNLTTVNTCAPSIFFSQTEMISEYAIFEKHLLSLIVEAVGFGIE